MIMDSMDLVKVFQNTHQNYNACSLHLNSLVRFSEQKPCYFGSLDSL